MIRAFDNGKHMQVEVNGTLPTIIGELASLIQSIHANFAQEFDETFADEIIANAGRMAFAKTDEERDEVGRECSDIITRLAAREVKKVASDLFEN